MADLSREHRMDLAARGHALPDGSYPTEDCAQWRDAIRAYGRETGDRAALRRYLLRRKVELGCPDALPESWHLERTSA